MVACFSKGIASCSEGIASSSEGVASCSQGIPTCGCSGVPPHEGEDVHEGDAVPVWGTDICEAGVRGDEAGV
eukprot:2456299-Pleurochrysis_carterae.AAC.1